jgi:hypothetical protein
MIDRFIFLTGMVAVGLIAVAVILAVTVVVALGIARGGP